MLLIGLTWWYQQSSAAPNQPQRYTDILLPNSTYSNHLSQYENPSLIMPTIHQKSKLSKAQYNDIITKMHIGMKKVEENRRRRRAYVARCASSIKGRSYKETLDVIVANIPHMAALERAKRAHDAERNLRDIAHVSRKMQARWAKKDAQSKENNTSDDAPLDTGSGPEPETILPSTVLSRRELLRSYQQMLRQVPGSYKELHRSASFGAASPPSSPPPYVGQPVSPDLSCLSHSPTQEFDDKVSYTGHQRTGKMKRITVQDIMSLSRPSTGGRLVSAKASILPDITHSPTPATGNSHLHVSSLRSLTTKVCPSTVEDSQDRTLSTRTNTDLSTHQVYHSEYPRYDDSLYGCSRSPTPESAISLDSKGDIKDSVMLACSNAAENSDPSILYRGQSPSGELQGCLNTRDYVFGCMSEIYRSGIRVGAVFEGRLKDIMDTTGRPGLMLMRRDDAICWVTGEDETKVRELMAAGTRVRVRGMWRCVEEVEDNWSNRFSVWWADLIWWVDESG
ncbi:hypothetical protein BJ508DRAFT_308111 [Ascobolus immersus RN42]|uniref:Uncharacterized protein n=1 Tax=Ascobolus immersus RN42 TaxID=1160509 RepID=A0A3N4I2Y2_ASCIM|nr:hypothetical protein BJ508DRAFT_308111 [Ascobolus immersus RN42]